MRTLFIFFNALLLILGVNSCKKDDANPIAIGKEYQGGIIFYVDETGKHGLIAAKVDQGKAEWGCPGTIIDGANGVAIGTGAQNTKDIIAGCNTADIAAKVCDALVLEGYQDWFLPSIDELKELMKQNGKVGGFIDEQHYWSSTEYGNSDKYAKFAFPSNQDAFINKGQPCYVRAIRSF